MAPVSCTTADPKELISADLFARLVARVMEDLKSEHALAERIVRQALVFLQACAENPGSRLSPTKIVDPGWHAFILDSEDYTKFCDRIAGRYIHHRPTRDGDEVPGPSLAYTIRALEGTGYQVDEELWRADAADCNQCHAGCHDSP